MATKNSTTKKASAKSTQKKTPAKKAAAKKDAQKKDAPTFTDDWKGAGTTLGELFADAGTSKEITEGKKLAKKLEDGKITNAELVALRDAVNATAAKLREEDKRDFAKKFSNANVLVRRAERATRKEA